MAGWLDTAAGVLMAQYLRLVWKTSRFVIEPTDVFERHKADEPAIIAMWHGQFLMAPFIRRDRRVKVLISRHRDGDAIAVAVEQLGAGTIAAPAITSGSSFERAASAPSGTWWRPSMNAGTSRSLPTFRRFSSRGRGIVLLARESGRPIYPIAMASSRRFEIRNWDRLVINLPFGRIALVASEPVWVPAEVKGEAFEAARQALEARLNAATERAYAIVDGGRAADRD